MNTNIQDDNVGNLGDILKHVALVELAHLIKDRNPLDKINYLDTNTYKIKAELSRSHSIYNDLFQLKGCSHSRYVNIEKHYVHYYKYLCSAGLVSTIIPDARLHLAEFDPYTFSILVEQLNEMQLTPELLLKDMHDFPSKIAEGKLYPTLALVDPFALNDNDWKDIWQIVCNSISKLHTADQDGIILVFKYEKADKVNWMQPPMNYSEEIIVLNHNPYHLAVYLTPDISNSVGETIGCFFDKNTLIPIK